MGCIRLMAPALAALAGLPAAILGLLLLAACGETKSDAQPTADTANVAHVAGEENSARPAAGTLATSTAGTHGGTGANASSDAQSADKAANNAVSLTAEEVDTLGITTQAAQLISYEPAAEGLGVVMSHDSIAQLAADLLVARAASRQSEAVLARAHRLASTPGALGAETVEIATRQVAADSAALQLTRRRLSATLGLTFPGRDDAGALLESMANGTARWVRVTFPLGSFSGKPPKSLRLWPLDASAPAAGWATSAVWEAPADSGLPGRSFFALLKSADPAEGSRVRALAVTDGGATGVLVPASAVIMSQGSYWCYLKKGALFVRTSVETTRPTPGGYFVAHGISQGEEIVISAVALLLARQSNPAAEAAD